MSSPLTVLHDPTQHVVASQALGPSVFWLRLRTQVDVDWCEGHEGDGDEQVRAGFCARVCA